MTGSQHGLRSGCAVRRHLLIGSALILASGILAYSANWDLKGAQRHLSQARRLQAELEKASNPSQAQYLECIKHFKQVYMLDPHFSRADDAIYETARLSQAVGERFGLPKYLKQAAKLYQFLVSDYDTSSFCPDALLSLGDLYARSLQDHEAARDAYQKLAQRYPRSAAAKTLASRRETLPQEAQPVKVLSADLSGASRPAMALVQNIRHWSTSDYTRVVIDMDVETSYRKTRLSNPDRIFFDISNAKLSPELLNKTFVIADVFLKQVRVGQNTSDVVRVVLDFAGISDFSVFELHDPYRIIIDIHGSQIAQSRSAAPAAAPVRVEDAPSAKLVASPTSPAAKPAEPSMRSVPPGTSEPSPASDKEGAKAASVRERREVSQRKEQELSPVAAAVKGVSPQKATEVQSAQPGTQTSVSAAAAGSDEFKSAGSVAPKVPSVAAAAAAPKAAVPTSRGNRTLTRVLGLKIGRIVIDPGHGGHDTGTIGRGGLKEKDLVLEVALELRKLLEAKLGAEVVLTREDDSFISLEERTAIANQKQADLFLSIHANSSNLRNISGVETYFLHFARTDAEREVAARENATTIRNIHELEDLIRRIAQADKSAESREFASIVQRKLYSGARQLFPSARNRGVRTAPFVVLIGANMPSVLAEVAFISNPRDEKLLKKEDNRARLARALFAGIEGYMKTLGSDVAQTQSNSN